MKNCAPQDPTVGLCLGPYGGPRGGADSYELGTPMYMHIRCMYIEVQVPVHAQNPLGVRTFHQVIQTHAIRTVLVFISLHDQNRKEQAPPLGNPVFKEIYWHCCRPENTLAPMSGGVSNLLTIFLDFPRSLSSKMRKYGRWHFLKMKNAHEKRSVARSQDQG